MARVFVFDEVAEVAEVDSGCCNRCCEGFGGCVRGKGARRCG
jgi:hypothetical protein